MKSYMLLFGATLLTATVLCGISPKVTGVVRSLQSVVEALASAAQPDNASHQVMDPKLNLIYKIVVDALNQLIPTLTEIRIPSLGDAAGALHVENAVIYGADKTTFGLAGEKGYNIDNMTVVIPVLEISAESYTLNNFNLSDMVTLNGNGRLYMKLEGIFLHCALTVKLQSLKFLVEHVPTFEIALSDSQLDFENLGAEGEALSQLLNSIANEVLPFVIQGLNGDVQAAKQNPDPAVWEAMEPAFNKLFTTLLNALKDNITLKSVPSGS